MARPRATTNNPADHAVRYRGSRRRIIEFSFPDGHTTGLIELRSADLPPKPDGSTIGGKTWIIDIYRVSGPLAILCDPDRVNPWTHQPAKEKPDTDQPTVSATAPQPAPESSE
ncbi:MAG TPA: hypothetical protein VFO16_14110 [Pseudonocardiaceae bacterium]|nr:hypothetical protein [Pseudonocardiaceae bacterium]